MIAQLSLHSVWNEKRVWQGRREVMCWIVGQWGAFSLISYIKWQTITPFSFIPPCTFGLWFLNRLLLTLVALSKQEPELLFEAFPIMENHHRNSRFKRVCVFCGSSPGKNPSYQLAAIQLGQQLVHLNSGSFSSTLRKPVSQFEFWLYVSMADEL